MKKVFLDCGANYFQGLKKLIKKLNIDTEWVIHSFEPNPNIEAAVPSNVNFHRKAVWVKNEIRSFSVEHHPADAPYPPNTGGASTLLDPGVANLPKFSKISVECIDFSNFIKTNFSKEDYIVVKLDIEGAEFEVVDKLISTGVIHYIDYLLIEYHDESSLSTNYRHEGFSESRKRQIQFFSDNGIKFELH